MLQMVKCTALGKEDVGSFSYVEYVSLDCSVPLPVTRRHASIPIAQSPPALWTREQRSGANAFDITYTYDGVGNRLTKLQSAVTTTYSYSVTNRLDTEQTPSATITYSYDDNGNTTLKETATEKTTYTWDKNNRLTVVALPSGTLLTMTYDGDNFRRSLQDGSGTTKFLHDRATWQPGIDSVLMELNASDVTVAEYTNLP